MIRILIFAVGIFSLLGTAGCQRLARLPVLLAGGPAPAVAAASSRSRASGPMQDRTIDVGGMERSYLVYVPKSIQPGRPAPLVMAFHGGGGEAGQFVSRMKLTEMADRYGMILVAPRGTGRRGNSGSWNADSMTPSGYAEKSGVNDLGFVDLLLRRMTAEYPVDPSRIYGVGFSKGGMMAYRVACALPGRFTAIAVVASTLSAPDCANPRGVSVLHIHGSNDQNVPFKGGSAELSGRGNNWPPVNRALDFFKTGNQCAPQAVTSRPASDTTCNVRSCNGEEAVELCLVDGGGHAWPGSPPANWQVRNNVYVSQNFDATEYIGRFLQQH